MNTFLANAQRGLMSLMLVSMIAVSVPAVAQSTNLAPTADDPTPKKPSRVHMTNKANGEDGCHDNVAQVSTPGPCPGTKH